MKLNKLRIVGEKSENQALKFVRFILSKKSLYDLCFYFIFIIIFNFMILECIQGLWHLLGLTLSLLFIYFS